MKPKHTPGPWEPRWEASEDMAHSVWTEDGHCVLDVRCNDTMTREDALLIAAAPELLEALEAILKTRATPWRADAAQATLRAESAIAKARGKP